MSDGLGQVIRHGHAVLRRHAGAPNVARQPLTLLVNTSLQPFDLVLVALNSALHSRSLGLDVALGDVDALDLAAGLRHSFPMRPLLGGDLVDAAADLVDPLVRIVDAVLIIVAALLLLLEGGLQRAALIADRINFLARIHWRRTAAYAG